MHHLAVDWALATTLLVSGCASNRCPTSKGPPAQLQAATAKAAPASAPPTATLAASANPTASASPTATATASPTASPTATANSADPTYAALGEPTADTHATRGLSGGTPRTAMTPNVTAIPSPPATLSVPPNAGVDQTLKAMPEGIPLGHLNREALEGPLRDPMRFARCRKGNGTRIEIDAVIYNGAALGVNVHTTPNEPALNFCIERIVRDTSWIKELAVNRVSVSI